MNLRGWVPLMMLIAGTSWTAFAHADTSPVTPSAMPPRRLSPEDCVALALRQNPDVLAGKFELEEAEAGRSGARGRFGPVVRVEGQALQWNSAFELPFAIPGAPGPAPALRVRDPFTWSATVTAVQPLTALFAIYDNYQLKDLGVDVAQLRGEATRREVAYRVVEAYYRLAQAMGLAQVAVASVDQLEAQRRQAESFHANGVVGKNDVLRAELAVATARQRVIQARGQITIARGRLATLMGLAPDTTIDLVPASDQVPSRRADTIEQAEARALSQRIEIKELDQRIQQTDKGVKLAYAKLAPQVNLVGSYMHSEGSAFAQVNSGYVGVTAGWDAWDWGTTTSGISEAKARVSQAKLARTKLTENIRLDTRQAYVNEATAAESVAVAAAAVTQAEENYRLTTKRYEANAATSFDVVDAEQLLTQARAQNETARYDYLVARAAAARAEGAGVVTAGSSR